MTNLYWRTEELTRSLLPKPFISEAEKKTQIESRWSMIPQQLRQLEMEIRSVKPQSQSIAYRIATWREHLPDNEALEFIYDAFPIKISREIIYSLVGKAVKSNQIEDIQRVFLATMIWGYGTTGYGPWRTAKMFATPGAIGVLERSFNLILQGNILDAYKGFNLKYCGQPYFSKYFYFIGYGSGQQDYPLILDTRVWKALKYKIQIDTSIYVKETSWWFPDGYHRYVLIMHEWAREMKCDAHNIEYVLFTLGGK